jgi:hypothetical protein
LDAVLRGGTVQLELLEAPLHPPPKYRGEGVLETTGVVRQKPGRLENQSQSYFPPATLLV